MRVCEHCGKEFTPKRHEKYCSPNHRKLASYHRLRQQRLSLVEQSERQQRQQLKTMLERLAQVAPNTAKSMRSFVDANGLECSLAAVRLCLTALHEGAQKSAA